MHSEGILAGELKHGPLALVDKLMPVIMIIMRDHTYNKCQNALQQVVARQVRTTHIPPLKYLEKLIFLGHNKEKVQDCNYLRKICYRVIQFCWNVCRFLQKTGKKNQETFVSNAALRYKS